MRTLLHALWSHWREKPRSMPPTLPPNAAHTRAVIDRLRCKYHAGEIDYRQLTLLLRCVTKEHELV